MDLSKAFNSSNHDILIIKLAYREVQNSASNLLKY